MPTRKRRKLNIKNLLVLLAPIILVIVLLITLLTKNNPAKEEVAKGNEEEVVEETNTEVEEEKDKVSFVFMGDGLLHESVYMDAQENGTYNFDKQLHYIKDIASKYDLAYYNQETILGGEELGLSGYPTFNSPFEFGEYMVNSGFNLVSTANNHCLDKGTIGIENSHEFWKGQNGVVMQGTNVSQEEYDAIATFEKNGIKFAYLSYTYGTNGIYPEYAYQVNYYRDHEQEVLDKIAQAKQENDVVIVAMHWGDEYSMQINNEQATLADEMTKAGADIIVGNHPHVIQPYQMVNGKPVFYAMGNLISTQLNEENLVGMIGALDIIKENDTITIENIRYDLVYTVMEGTYPALRYNVEVIPFSKLTDEQLADHEAIYEKYKAVVTSLDDSIVCGGIE